MLLSYSRFQPFSVSASGCLFVARHLQLISMFLSLHSSSRLLRERTCEVLEDREEEKNPASCRKRTCITAKRKKATEHNTALDCKVTQLRKYTVFLFGEALSLLPKIVQHYARLVGGCVGVRWSVCMYVGEELNHLLFSGSLHPHIPLGKGL